MSSHHYQSVLPDNSTPFMRAVEKAFRAQLESVNEPFPDLLNSALTPQQFLAVLAAERGVNDWFESDTEEDQRNIVGNALPLQKEAGTRKGLKLASESIGMDAVITPWFKKEDGKPYEIYISAYAPEKPIDVDTLARFDARINKHKSERDVVYTEIGRISTASKFVGVTMEFGVTMTSQPYVSSGSESEAAISVGAFNHLRIISTSEPAIQ